LGLIVAQVVYGIKFAEGVWELLQHFWTMDETQVMLAVLTLIDIVMIANLLKMIISGSYQTFVDKASSPEGEKVSSGLLKVKMGSSLIGVSSIHLLQVFLNSDGLTDRDLLVKITIHVVFLVSTVGLAVIDWLHVKSEATEHKTENKVKNLSGFPRIH